jgi:hypothetical protein
MTMLYIAPERVQALAVLALDAEAQAKHPVAIDVLKVIVGQNAVLNGVLSPEIETVVAQDHAEAARRRRVPPSRRVT